MAAYAETHVSDFDLVVGEQQVAWRRRHVASTEHGRQNGVARPWILPMRFWEEGLWPGIRTGSPDPLPAYLTTNGVQKHGGCHNLKSSWMLCANLYFPFRQDRSLLAGFLAEHMSVAIKTVEAVELEYAEPAPLDPQTLLGEPAGGQRGSNQTSPDVAFVVGTAKRGVGLILVENMFTEHSFYNCSGRDKQYGNPDASRCLRFAEIYADLPNRCYQLHWQAEQRPNRRYWDWLRVSPHGQQILERCPAATGGYQLLRQQALAEAIAQSRRYEFVASAVAYDERNSDLLVSLRGTGIADFREGWARLFDGEALFASFSHQQWVAWVREQDRDGRWRDWQEYVRERYEL